MDLAPRANRFPSDTQSEAVLESRRDKFPGEAAEHGSEQGVGEARPASHLVDTNGPMNDNVIQRETT